MDEPREGKGWQTVAAAALGAAIPLVAGCGSAPTAEPAPLVAVSVLPQAWFVAQLAGDRVRVAVMIPPGASPASHEPAIEDVRAIDEAILYVRVGRLPFETAWLARLLAERKDLPVVSAPGAGDPATDPHVWLAPRSARAMARSLHGALAKQLPADREALDAGLAALLGEIDATDAYCRQRLAPKRGGRFWVYHPAWSHFAEAYGLVQVAIQRGGKEPDARTLADLIRQAKAARVPVVFVQPHFDTAAAHVIANEIGARVEVLDPLAYPWARNLRHAADALAAAAVPE
jgi:zinc transport system substrate-binding protein